MLEGADLTKTDPSRANLTGADLSDADRSGCRICGLSAGVVKLDSTRQQNLIITRDSS